MNDHTTDRASGTSRRTLVRGAAWSVPVIAVAATAPAFAVSPCAAKTALLPVTWSATWSTTAQTGTTANGTTVNVTGAYTATAAGGGSINAQNMTPQQALTARDSFVIYNNSPTTLALDGSANYQTVTFSFTQPVFGLTFSIDDIDRNTGYWDQVSLTATPAEAPAFAAGSSVAGAGTDANPWRTNTTTAGDNAPAQTVTATYANGLVGISTVKLRFWSTLLPATPAGHLLRLRQMSFRTCA